MGIKWIRGIRESYYVGDVIFLEVLHREQIFGLPTIGREVQFLHQKEAENSKMLPKSLRDLRKQYQRIPCKELFRNGRDTETLNLCREVHSPLQTCPFNSTDVTTVMFSLVSGKHPHSSLLS